jgi:transposase
MKKLREVLRLKIDLKLSNREIGNMLGISSSTVSLYVTTFKRKEIPWDQANSLGDDELNKMLFPVQHLSPKRQFAKPDFEYIHKELKRKGVTLQLLWEEYYDVHKDQSYSRTQFCVLYQEWSRKLNISMRQRHKAGDKLFIDYAGQTIPIVDINTGEIKQAQIFTAVMGASNYTYAEATWSQSLPDWIGSHVRAFEYFGGVVALLVPDNLRSGINKACRYEPDANPLYADMVSYYGTAVLPARPYKPKDKAKVEVGVQIIERWILARLRNHKFFSLTELNQEIRRLLNIANNKAFKKLPGTRLSQFEAIDKPALRPLPTQPYIYSDFKHVRLGFDYHIEIDRHYYSAPYQLIKEKLEVRMTENTVEIFHKNKRIISHIRSHRKGSHTTISEHMPTRHQKHMQWTPGRLLNWGKSIGPQTLIVTKHILQKKDHPEQGYRACLGLLNLAKAYSKERLETACGRAVFYNIFTRRSVANILKEGADKQPLPTNDTEPKNLNHENIRGPKYFTPDDEEDI